MRATLLAALGVLFVGFTPCGGHAQTPTPPGQTPPGSAPSSPTTTPMRLPGPGCEDPPPPTGAPCEIYKCTNGVWVLGLRAPGTTCSDGNACTYGDKCNAAGQCLGTDVRLFCDSQCKACNGTASCGTSPAPAGRVCRAVASPPSCDKAETCSGTAVGCPADNSQGWADVGTACSSVPGFDLGCGCTAAGACTVKNPPTGAEAVTGICWDARGNMRAKFIAPPGASCVTRCPDP